MSGPKKDKVILSEQGVVTEEALTAYLQNKLSPDEKQQMEKLLQEDPFAQDALEGLQSSLNQAAVQTSISSLNKKVRERSGLKERKGLKLHWVSYAWAAVVFGLLIGIGFIMVNFLNKKDNNTAASKSNENITAPATARAKDTVTAKPKAAVADSLVNKPGTNALAANTPLPNNGKSVNDSVIASPQVAKPVQPVMSQTTANMAKPVAANAAQTNKSVVVKSTAASTDKNTQTAPSDAKDAGSLQDEAMKSFNSGDYNTAGDNFDKILKHDPDNADALYFGGISDYINGKTAKSETNFDKLLKKGNKYIEGSKWYKANILIKKGHSEAAKSLLQDLSNSNGSYKERAIKKLAEMGY